VHTILIAQEVYTTSITDWDSPESLAAPFSSLVITIIFGSLITCMVQIMFAIRIRKVSGSPWIMLLCSFLAILCVVGGVVVSVEGLKLNSLTLFYPKFGWLITTTLTVEAFVDVVIAVSMCFYLKQHTPVFTSTNEIINQLMVWTIQTGVVTSLTAISLVITFQTVVPTNFAWLALYTVLAKVYTNSLLASLNGRKKFRGRLDNSIAVNSVMLEFQAPSGTNQTTPGSDIESRPGESHHLQFTNPDKKTTTNGTKTESTGRSY